MINAWRLLYDEVLKMKTDHYFDEMPENIANQTLSADSSAAEYTSANAGTAINLLSNGFKPGGAGGDMNGNNETYIYIAFAETPFKYSNAR